MELVMQNMLNLQKLQSLAQLTSGAAAASVLPGLGLSTGGLPSALLNNSPLNLSLGSQGHSPVMGALAAATAPQPLPPAPANTMPQLILASGQIVQGIQVAQLLIPTSQGIATQTILTIPVGQQVISNMSSENLLQCLNFNTVASAAANAASFGDLLNQSAGHHPHHHHHHHHAATVGSAAFAAAAAAAAAVNATRESPVTVNSAINSTASSLLTNPLALAAAAVANSNHHHQQQQHHHGHHPSASAIAAHQLHQHQQQQQHQQTQQAKHLHFGSPSTAISGLSSPIPPCSGGGHLPPTSSSSNISGNNSNSIEKFKLSHEKAPSSGRSTPEMVRIKLESPKVPSPISLIPSRPPSGNFGSSPSVFDKRTHSPSVSSGEIGSSGNTTINSSNSGIGSSNGGASTTTVGQIHVSKNLTSPHHSPADSAISRITTSNGEITVTKSQAPQTPPLPVQNKNHPASMHFNPSISPQPSSMGIGSHHHHQHHHQQQHQQQHHHHQSGRSPHHHGSSTTPSATATSSSANSSGVGVDLHLQSLSSSSNSKEQQQQKPSTSSSMMRSTSTPGVISLTLDDVMDSKISTHSLGGSSASSSSALSLSKRHRSLTPPPRAKLSPDGSGSIQLSQDDDDGEDVEDGDEDNSSGHHNNNNNNDLEDSPNELTINQTNCNVVDGIDLEDIKEFAKAFKLRRLSLGLTQTQVGQALSVTEGPAYSQSAICSALAAQMYCAAQLSSQQQQMFEKLDITPKSAQKIKPVLERWMKEAEESHSSRFKSNQNHLTDFIGVEPSKKRKRRTSFTPQALELLNGHFERNTHPSGTEITGLAHQLGYEREVIRIWFCNKRQALKNTVRMMSKNFKMESS
ncbi:POU domain, class 6, transcription factor 2-like isoform X4 [Uranotaenia lowii]|uniref:POU domain, class 6, transcription factor 2-like isoform X4 n=1 Tax=Uranotaenia lowii TaxID=190385 RepID=UPI00247A38B9|nr:POU domain, class 6, transcription factor 2-like isoform X4 [Uranotaenia lowii]